MGAFSLCFMLVVMGGKRWIHQNEEKERELQMSALLMQLNIIDRVERFPVK